MSFAKPTSLGVIACPGGEQFADEIISHLKSIYRSRFDKKTNYIAKLYGMERETVVREANLADDLTAHRIRSVGDADGYRPPSFKIPCKLTHFANGEVKAEIMRSVRGVDLYIVQDVSNNTPILLAGQDKPQVLSINDHLMILLVTIDTAMKSGARQVTLVLPAYPYSRQHKAKGREGLTASTLGRIFENLGVVRILTLDIHSTEIAHCFHKLAMENLHASYQILRTLHSKMDLLDEDLVVVSPDTGAIERNRYFANSLGKPLALLYKERDYSKVSLAGDSNITTVRLLGDVQGKTVFMADDMLGTGGTLIEAIKLIRDLGAKKIVCAVSLPLFSGSAAEQFDEVYAEGGFDYLIGTNGVTLSQDILNRDWFHSANVSNLFARAISRLHHNRSMSPLLDNSKLIQRMLKESQPTED